MPKTYHFLNVSLPVANRQETLTLIENASVTKPLTVATVNPEFILEAGRNDLFKKALETSSICTIDGSGLYILMNWWNRIRKNPPVELYQGADLVADLLGTYQNGEKSFYFLGGPPGLATTAKAIITKQYPNIRIIGDSDGGVIDSKNVVITAKLKEELERSKPDIVLVGFGAPKQELWIQQASLALSIPVMIGVGGTLGFYSQKKRASALMRRLHLEWLKRSFTEPGHWKRAWQAVVVFSFKAFFWMLKELMRPSHNPKKA